MTTLDSSRETLAWAANRLTEAHRTVDLPAKAFSEVLETYLLATRAYHQTIRETNERVRHDNERVTSRTEQAHRRVQGNTEHAQPYSAQPVQFHAL